MKNLFPQYKNHRRFPNPPKLVHKKNTIVRVRNWQIMEGKSENKGNFDDFRKNIDLSEKSGKKDMNTPLIRVWTEP